ncbi:hypothetical protein [Amorphus sp. 3PC139-8]|uniref:hypothetical protein n=1 Tax=Amorphus sp. 3PC139-8 TaxID=2735676 RepID=UPI00345CC78A
MAAPWNRTDWSLDEWIAYAWEIERRRCGRPRDEACTRHVQRFPGHLVSVEIDRATLVALKDLLVRSHPGLFGRPSRGGRANHWTTSVFVDANNQLAKLGRIRGRNTP